jgi:radical SAM protein with 4Fe4S-binding SPASM domain
MVTARNYTSIKDRILELDEYGVDRIAVNNYCYVHGKQNHELLLTREQELEVIQIVKNLYQSADKYRQLVKMQGGFYHKEYFENIAANPITSCLCGYFRASITSEGYLVPCEMLCIDEYLNIFKDSYDIPNLLNTSITEAFNESELFRDISNASVSCIPPKCKSCNFVAKCSHGCRVISYYYGGSLYADDPSCDIRT